jgi:putative sigma-54 modulation protein
MKKTEQFQNIKLDIQTVNFDPTSATMANVRQELKKLMRLYGNIVGADVYLLETNVSELKNKVARIRVGVPGRDLFAESAANSWMQAISDVAAKLRSQIMSR